MARPKTPEGTRLVVHERTRSLVVYKAYRDGKHVGMVVGRTESWKGARKMWDYLVGTEFSWSRDRLVYPSRTAGQALDNLLSALDRA
jgi:hypothetical protein